MKLTKLIQALSNLNVRYGEMEVKCPSNLVCMLTCNKMIKETGFVGKYIDLNKEKQDESIQSS